MNNVIKHWFVIFFLFCSIFSSVLVTFTNDNTAVAAAASWWDSEWVYCKKIIINSSLIAGDLTNFPVLIQNTSADFANARNDGFDFRFLNETNETEYYFELEGFNSTTNTITAWVNITSLSSTTDTVVWMYYGNSSASADASSTSTWDSDYLAVWHLNNSLEDSTSNNYDLVANNVTANTSGIAGSSYDFEIDNLKTNLSNRTILDTWPVELTWECWFNAESTAAGQNMYLMSKDQTATNTNTLVYWINAPNNIWISQESSGSGIQHQNLSVTISSGSWYYGAVTYKDNDHARGFLNGLHYDDLATGNIADGHVFDFVLGNIRNADVYPYDGLMDEVRISNVNRSSNWINTTFRTINDVSSFISVSAQLENEPKAPTNFVATTESTSSINVSWTKDANATHTRIQRSTTTYPTTISDGTNIYNGTGTYVVNTGLTRSVIYYYSAWSFNSTTGNWSAHVETTNYTGPVNPTNIDTDLISDDLNMSWVVGTNADTTRIQRKTGSYPTGPADGTNIYNNTGTYYIDTNVLQNYHYRLFSWDTRTNLYSVGYNLSWGSLVVNCYDEDTNDSLTFDIFITDSPGINTYYQTHCSNPTTVDPDDLPLGEDISIRISANESYDNRSEVFTGYSWNQNASTTYVILEVPPNSKADTNVTCFNGSAKEYPPFALSGDIITISPGSIGRFDRIWVNYTYQTYIPRFFNQNFEVNTFYTLDAYLTPVEETPTQSYILTVQDPYFYPIDDVTIRIDRFLPFLLDYATITSLHTDANGEVSVDLIPDEIYKINLSRTGYVTKTEEFTPTSSISGKTFFMSLEAGNDSTLIFWNIIRFNGTRYANGSIFVQYEDIKTNTTNAVFSTYEHYNGTSTFVAQNTTTSDTFSFWVVGLNGSRQHIVYIKLNHTQLGYVNNSITIDIYRTVAKNRTSIESKFRNVLGDFALKYVPFLLVYLPIIGLLVVFGPNHAGLGAITSGLYLGLVSTQLTLPAELIPISIFTIALGFILMVVKGGGIKL